MPRPNWLRPSGAPHHRHPLSTRRPSRRWVSLPSALLVLATVAVVAGCGESPTTPASPRVPQASRSGGSGNSLNAKACQKNGWQGLVTSTGDPFSSEEACVSYAAEGGTLYRTQTITFGALGGKTFGDADFSVSATVSSGLTVTFTASGDCTVSGTTVHLTGAGSCTITAHQAGDATWYAAPDVSQSFAIAKGNQTIAFTSTSPALRVLGGPTYTPTATASSGLPVAITLDGASTGCSLAGGVVSFSGAGTCVIDANQAGDIDWNPATQQQQSIVVLACIGTEAALRAAAAAGGAYTFCAAGTTIMLTGGEVGVSTTLSLTGVSGGNAVINANNLSRVFHVMSGNLTLRDVTVTGGRSLVEGGGIYVDNGVVVLNGNTDVTGNVANSGGGVYVFGSLTMNDGSSVSNNSALHLTYAVASGGGVEVYSSLSSFTMNGTSTVRGNMTEGYWSQGGGVTNNGGLVTLNGASAIRSNVAGPSNLAGLSRGGGIYDVNGGSLTLNTSVGITLNTAVDDGGGIYRIDGGFGTFTGITAANVINNTPNNCAHGTFDPPVPGCVS